MTIDPFILQSDDVLPGRIGDQVKRMIERGGFRRGDPLPSYRELCGRYKVSLVTVKRAMDALARDGIVHVQPGKGVFVDKELTPQARKLNQIGVVFYCSRKLMFSSQYLVEIFQGVLQESEAIAADTRLFSVKSEGPLPPEEVETSGVDGVILVGVTNEKYLRAFACQQMPVVAVDVWASGIPLEFVVADNGAAAQRMTEYLVKLGHRRIEYVDGWTTDTVQRNDPVVEGVDMQERRTGFICTMASLGLSGAAIYRTACSTPEAAILAAADRIAGSCPRATAVLAYDTTIARKLIERFGALGLSVPRDISVAAVAGAGDALAGSMTLTYNRMRFFDMGAQAVQALNERCRQSRLERRTEIRIGSDFVEGNTTAALSS